MIGHGGFLRVFSFTRPVRASGHVQGMYHQACPDETRFFVKKRLRYPRVG